MRIYLCSGYLSTETQRKLSVMKHRSLFLFHTQLILLASGLRVERRTGCGGGLLHYDFYIQLLFLHTNAIDETALWIFELSKFEHN